ncbi:MFS domain-containing protein [Mycena indigotica]|uniref:MFS domain-containing protein n=1 Tax=Mycena indigotica TaxID=2126181 RepID=A0A8H6RY49_9AGAR|nr:MFS domain-containing protein [Mycena indigotica]KAF7288735.1 MFS domain-containing protein [Mycena indigotica]
MPSNYAPLPNDDSVLLPRESDEDITAHSRLLPSLQTNADSGLKVAEDSSYTYSYGPPGLSGLWHNYYAFLCAVFGVHRRAELWIANVLVMEDFVGRWPITPLQKGALTAVLELGALIGALTFGVLADRYSRRHSIFIACVIFNIGALFQTFARTLADLFIGRAIGGIGVGALSMLSPLYISEISPPEVRGSLIALEQFSIVLGVVVGFWIGFFTRNIPGSASWRIPLSVQIGPGVLLAFGALFLLPASPRLLVLKGKYDEAEASLVKLRGRDDALTKIELLEMRVEAVLISQSDSDSPKPGMLSAWRQLFSKKYRPRTLVGGSYDVLPTQVTVYLVFLQSIGLKGITTLLIVSGGIGIVQFIAVGPAVIYIDRVGRKPLLRGGSSFMAASHLIIAILVMQVQSDWSSHAIAAWAAVAAIYTFTFAYGVSFGPIGWVLPSEVFPLSMRGRGVALSTASNWSNNFFIGLVTPIMMEYSPAGTFLTFATACFVAYLWATYMVPETAGVTLEDMDRVFGGDAGREDRVRRRELEEEMGLRAMPASIYPTRVQVATLTSGSAQARQRAIRRNANDGGSGSWTQSLASVVLARGKRKDGDVKSENREDEIYGDSEWSKRFCGLTLARGGWPSPLLVEGAAMGTSPCPCARCDTLAVCRPRPVNTPTAMSFLVPLPLPGYRARPRLNGKECYYGADAEDYESDSDYLVFDTKQRQKSTRIVRNVA